MIKLGIFCFLVGVVFGVFIVALLAWLGEIKEQKELQKKLEELRTKNHD